VSGRLSTTRNDSGPDGAPRTPMRCIGISATRQFLPTNAWHRAPALPW